MRPTSGVTVALRKLLAESAKPGRSPSGEGPGSLPSATAREVLDQIEQSAEAWVTVDMHTDVHRLVAALRAVLDQIDENREWRRRFPGEATAISSEDVYRAITEALGGGA